MDYKEKIEKKRQNLVNTLIDFIENNSDQWNAGWYSMPLEAPRNGKTDKKYNGLNAFYLSILASIHGYSDPRWVTFNQAKDLGANVKQGEKANDIFFWSFYDKKTKTQFDNNTCKGMSFQEKKDYWDENVRPVLKYYNVFNAAQCENMPEYEHKTTPEMEKEERQRQNDIAEQIIKNSAAPINYDGGNRAYYSPLNDNIHLPQIKDFKTMQDYYATALHEIAHSTGHESRLGRNLKDSFGTPGYAKEELRAELASIFMQFDLGLAIEGKHFENHGAYLQSWLTAVKNNKNEFFNAASDAEKITKFVSENYLHNKEQKENTTLEQSKKPLVVNFYAGPGAGKTTSALELTAALKKAGINVEYVSEYAKELVLEGKADLLSDQRHVTDEQYHRIDRLRNSVDVIVTDSPVLLGVIYGGERIDDTYRQQLRSYYDSFDNLDLYVERKAEYQTNGRVETEQQAKALDTAISQMLEQQNINYKTFASDIVQDTVELVKKQITVTPEQSEKQQNIAVEKASESEKQQNNKSAFYAQYMDIQTKNADAIVLQQLGDFYEVLGTNAKIVAKSLDITLAARDIGDGEREAMCGFPVYNGDKYISKLRENNDVVVKDKNGETVLSKIVQQAEQGRQVPLSLTEQIAELSYESDNTNRLMRQISYDNLVKIAERNGIDYGSLKLDVKWDMDIDTAKMELKALHNNIFEAKSWIEYFHSKSNQQTGDVSIWYYEGRLQEMAEKENTVEQTNKNEIKKGDTKINTDEKEKKSLLPPSEYYAQKNAKRLDAIDKNIPKEMKDTPNWCAFRTYYNNETGKKRKVILSPKTSEWAKCNDSNTWTDYATAMEFARAKNCEGLSFALEPKNRIVCVDLDGCIGEKGMRSELCWNILNASKNTYSEKSVSGKGMHVFFKADNMLEGVNKHVESKGLECYDRAKFMSITGNMVSSENKLVECPEKLHRLLRNELGTSKSATTRVSGSPQKTNLSEQEIIAKIRTSKSGDDFKKMFDEGVDLCGDLSRTDCKLMSMLSFFTSQDAAKMKNIFEQSALYRPEKKESYINRTIEFVNSTQVKKYNPGGQSRSHGKSRGK